jgi:ribonuclease-3
LGTIKSFFSGKKSPDEIRLIRFIIQSFGYRPNNLNVFAQALVHKSMISADNKSESNERLEFLGDAIIDLIVAEYLYELYPGDDEGYLTRLKSKIVNRKSLSLIGNKMGIRDYLIYNSDRTVNLHTLEGNAFEALMGAMYLDAGYNRTKKSFRNHVIRKYANINRLIEEEVDFKSRLLIWCQRKHLLLEFMVVSETKVNNETFFVVIAVINKKNYGQGKGTAKKVAEQKAAKETLDLMGETY